MAKKLDLRLDRFQDQLKVKKEKGKRFLWDLIRSKWLVLQPEELVRQLLILYMIKDLDFNRNRMAVEKGLTVNNLQKRCDILVYNDSLEPFLLVECKAPSVKLNEATFRQIAQYNLTLKVPYLLVCNGPEAYCCKIDFELEQFEFLTEIPTN